jgi:glucose-1-phosphate adenylyltransferase
MELLVPEPPIDLYDTAWPIMTAPEQLPPARLLFDSARQGSVANSLLGGGVVIRGAAVTNSVLSSRVQIGEGSTLDEAVVLPGARIGSSCHLRRVIIDAGLEIPDGTVIGAGEQVTLLARDSLPNPKAAGDLRSVA